MQYVDHVTLTLSIMLSLHCLTVAGDVSIGIKCAPGVVGPAEADIDFDIIKNDNDTFTVKYTPPGPGRYTIMVLFADQVGLGGASLAVVHGHVTSTVNRDMFFSLGCRKFPSARSASKWIPPTMLLR